MPWTDYIIPVAIGACLLAVAVVASVYTLIEKWLDLKEWYARWWYHQMERAEKREAALRVRPPLLSINVHKRAADYVDEEDEDTAQESVVSVGEKTTKTDVSGVNTGEIELPDFLPETDVWAIFSALEATGTKRTDIYKALQVKPGSGKEYTFVKAQLDAAADRRGAHYRNTSEEEAAVQERRRQLGLRTSAKSR